MKLRPFRTLLVRRAVLAPEMDRLLSRRHLDLAVTNQIEALQVRARAGVEVFQRRLQVARARAQRRLTLLAGALALCFALAAAASAITWAPGHEYNGWLATALGLSGAAFAGFAFARLGLDAVQLRRLLGRYTGYIERAETAGELLAFSEQVLDEARRVGAVPRMDEAG
jgi:hypothetical protein